ncbi:hypothetical protein D8I35_09525 [Corticibacter populi]|uniref:Uncharacterized protein n=1 Tax=Corticibacter populi TaxID=1550736 RepID=A0A3M6QV15_9BURK|nr:Cro/CI family transcriptional regulator [Corticibacter populi]RMX06731.1 hypothetical protein D8I35_09525 [Corticibacter populi]
MPHPIAIASEIVGSQRALAKRLGVTPAAVWQWMEDGRKVPIQHCPAIEKMTADSVTPVTRRDLRPDDWHLIWPELVEAQPVVSPPESANALPTASREAADA